MTEHRVIGDIHGNVTYYKTYCIGDFTGPTIQVGDFGVGFGQSEFWYKSLNEFHSSGDHTFIRGNHDNPATCKKIPSWIPDGTVKNDIMFLGGAFSIDQEWRTEGLDWWPDEECSISELMEFIDIYSVVKPRIMITHDGPMSVTEQMFIKTGRAMGGPNAQMYPTRTGQALDAMFRNHQPEFWFMGHWHHTMTYNENGTTFVCLGEFDYIDVDLSDSNQIHRAIMEKFA